MVQASGALANSSNIAAGDSCRIRVTAMATPRRCQLLTTQASKLTRSLHASSCVAVHHCGHGYHGEVAKYRPITQHSAVTEHGAVAQHGAITQHGAVAQHGATTEHCAVAEYCPRANED